jgi:hypothetical protein
LDLACFSDYKSTEQDIPDLFYQLVYLIHRGSKSTSKSTKSSTWDMVGLPDGQQADGQQDDGQQDDGQQDDGQQDDGQQDGQQGRNSPILLNY